MQNGPAGEKPVVRFLGCELSLGSALLRQLSSFDLDLELVVTCLQV